MRHFVNLAFLYFLLRKIIAKDKAKIFKPIILRYNERLDKIKSGCSEICNTSISGTPSLYFPAITKHVNCSLLIQNTAIDESRPVGFPPDIPIEMVPLFSYDGRVELGRYDGQFGATLLNDQYLGSNASMAIWKKGLVNEWKSKCTFGTLEGNYGKNETAYVYSGLLRMKTVRGGHVLVIGSENPWLESCALAAGAAKVTTLEYGYISSEHPQLETMTPSKLRNLYAMNQLPLFDAIATFSSVEHSGLGRYGDALNPWGDLQAIARAWCLAKKNAQLLIGVMTAHDLKDRIEFNAHRVYGPLMLSHLLANWKQIWRANGGFQVVHILEKTQ